MKYLSFCQTLQQNNNTKNFSFFSVYRTNMSRIFKKSKKLTLLPISIRSFSISSSVSFKNSASLSKSSSKTLFSTWFAAMFLISVRLVCHVTKKTTFERKSFDLTGRRMKVSILSIVIPSNSTVSLSLITIELIFNFTLLHCFLPRIIN